MDTLELPITNELHQEMLRTACLEIEWLHTVGRPTEAVPMLNLVVQIIARAGHGGPNLA